MPGPAFDANMALLYGRFVQAAYTMYGNSPAALRHHYLTTLLRNISSRHGSKYRISCASASKNIGTNWRITRGVPRTLRACDTTLPLTLLLASVFVGRPGSSCFRQVQPELQAMRPIGLLAKFSPHDMTILQPEAMG